MVAERKAAPRIGNPRVKEQVDASYGVDMPGLEVPLNEERRMREAAKEDEALEDSPRTRTVNIPPTCVLSRRCVG